MAKDPEWQNQLSRVFIHNDLVLELKLRKEDLEKKIKNEISGGVPVVSKLVAQILKNQRLGIDKKIVVEFHKILGKRSNQIIII